MMSLRQANLADLPALVPLFDAYRSFYCQASDPLAAQAFLRERLQRGESTVIVAFADDVMIGFTQLYPLFTSISLGRTYLLNDLFVAPPWRRHGVGRRLIDAAADFARGQGALEISLSTALDNRVAQSVYTAAGWQRDLEFCTYAQSLRPG